MTNSETIARLEALLERVRTRRVEARVRSPQVPQGIAVPAAGAPAPAPARAPAAAPPRAPFAPTPAVPIHAVAIAPSVTRADDPFSDTDLPTRPPPRTEPPAVEIEVDIEVQEPIEERAAGPVGSFEGARPPVPVREAFDSRERLVVAEPAALEPASEPLASGPVVPAGEVVAQDAGVAEEYVRESAREDEAPISSQRPVSEPEEHLAQMAFGAEESRPPRHTPPPESGRLPAAPEVDFDADVTGVRQAPAAVAPASHLEPQVIGGTIGTSAVVADVVGEAQIFAPATFVDLVDASLGL